MALTKLEIPVEGMDCAECTMHVQHALAALPGVEEVHVLLSSEKAVLQVDPAQVDLPAIHSESKGIIEIKIECWLRAFNPDPASSLYALPSILPRIFTLERLIPCYSPAML